MYCSVQEVLQAATQMAIGAKSADSPTLITAETLANRIEQASRIFDAAANARAGYFESAYYPVWQSSHVYAVGDVVTPTTRNSHKYRVTTAGTSGTSEPTFPTSGSATVTSGSVTFTEYGADVVVSSRTFYGTGGTILRLDPYIAGTLNTSISVPTGYTAPTFIERDGVLIQVDSQSVAIGYSPSAYPQGWWSGVPVTVSALWGFDGVPADVKAAAIELTINLWREIDPASVKLVNLDGQALRESLPPRVNAIARRYRLTAAEVIFA